MKKKIALMMMLVMMLSMVGCSGKGNETDDSDSSNVTSQSTTENTDVNEDGAGKVELSKATVTFSKESEERLSVEVDAATAVNQYLVARCYLDKFLQYDIENGNPEEYQQLLAETINAFEIVGETAAVLEESAAELEELEASDSYEGTDGSGSFDEVASIKAPSTISWDPFVVNAYAEEESEAVKWARDLTERFDKAPAGKGIRTLASQMGTDAKHAYAQLRQAQDILAGAAYSDFAKTADTAYKTAKVLKTAGAGAQLTLSIITANPASMTEAVIASGGILFNGINTALEVGQTGSILLVGDDNKVSQTLENIQNAAAPIGATIGLFSLGSNLAKGAEFFKDTAAKADAIMYLGTSLYDYLSEGKIMGGTLTQHEDGTIEGTLVETMTVKSAWEKPEVATEEVLTSIGYTKEEIAEVVSAPETSETTTDTTVAATDEIPLEIIDAIMEYLPEYVETVESTTPELDEIADIDSDDVNEDDANIDNADEDDSDEDVDDSEDADADDEADETDDADEISEFPSASEIVGSYNVSVHMTMGDQEADGTLEFKFSTSGNSLTVTDYTGYSMSGTYDPSTGKGTTTDASDGSVYHFTFTRSGKSIKVKVNMSADYGSISGSGTKG